MNFGASQTSAPQSTFGTNTGFGFGSSNTTQGSSGFSGFGFGAPATSATSNPGFGFGSGFQSAPGTGFSFGAPAAATTTTSMFSFNGLGAQPQPTSTFSFGNIGAPTSTTQSGFSFGAQPSAFGGVGAGFGATASAIPAAATNTQIMENQNLNFFTAAVTKPTIYGDVRDEILLKWNQLQAGYGTGKGYFAPNSPPVEFTPDNNLCRFKTVCYNCIPSAKPEEGLVNLVFNKKEDLIRNQQQLIIDGLKTCFGNKPNITICVESIKSLPENKTEVVIYLMEQPIAGPAVRIKPTEICTYLEQPQMKQLLVNMGIVNVYSRTIMTKEERQIFLNNPPPGIAPEIWSQAIKDNPDPDRFMPIPVKGFCDLHKRMKQQEHEIKRHDERLNVIAEDIAELSSRHTTSSAKVEESKRKLLELQHKVLKALVQQEITRKMGFTIQSDEEELRINLEAIQAELSAPTQFKGHLKEMISRIHMQNYQGSTGCDSESGYCMDETSKHQLKEHLRMQQEGISHLISYIKDDMADLKTLAEISKVVAESN